MAATFGAPGFEIKYTNIFDYDLHYVEFEDSEMDYLPGGANAIY